MRYPRYRAAVKEKEAYVKKLFAQKGVEYPPSEIYIRAFKSEETVELWARSNKEDKFRLVTEYGFCASSGKLGPKTRQGDGQIPEGYYHIDRFNPASSYHLSLGLNYPNAYDRSLGRTGGDIFLHGNCVTIGCIPLTDDKIKELYIVAVEVKSNGQPEIPVHIFPARLGDKNFRTLKAAYRRDTGLIEFWAGLKTTYDYFAANKQIPKGVE